jgi:amino acid adenylation domain-containing protein
MNFIEPILDKRDTDLQFDRSQTIVSLFLTHVQNRPDKVAVIEDEHCLSYSELAARAAGIADALCQVGVRRGDCVALFARRGIETVGAQLGAMALGAAFVPLDPGMPKQHAVEVANAACPSAILCHREDVDAAKAVAPLTCHVVMLQGEDNPQARSLDQLIADPVAQVGPDDLAYVIYTSGSTGKPKGVMVPHRGVCRLVCGQDYADLGPDQVMLNMAAVGFDANIGEIYSAILNGGTLAILSDATPSLNRIAEVILRDRVTIAYITAGLFHVIAEHRLEILGTLDQVFPCGDVLSETHVQRVRGAHPHLRMINGYGPTENTVFTCCFPIDARWNGGPIPIGRGLNHDRLFVLNDDLCPLPDGQVGQLAVGGAGVALGYLGRPDLTKAAFVTLEIQGAKHRVYLTGDLVLRDAGGVVWFHGRLDRQIKINGQRVELDAVEHALRADVAVADAVAVAVPSQNGSRRIAAFVTSAQNGDSQEDLVAAVLDRMRATMPAAAIPSQMVLCEDFPLSGSGKVDRKKLAAELAQANPATISKAETGSLRDIIRQCWQEVLGRDVPDFDKTFFDLGGSSLQLIAMHSQLQQRLGRTFDIAKLFEAPRIRDLERLMGAHETVEVDPIAASRANMAGARARRRVRS